MIAHKVPTWELRQYMADEGLTGAEVARILNVARQTAYCYMCGVRAMKRRQLDRVKARVTARKTLEQVQDTQRA